MTCKFQPQNLRGFFILTGFATLATLIAAVAMVVLNLRWNPTPSLPIGYYRIVTDGSLIAFCPHGETALIANTRHYRPPGTDCPDGYAPLLKPIAAREGDHVTVTAFGIMVNGKTLPNTRQYSVDHSNRPMQRVPPGTYIVAPGTVWVLSTYSPNSYDSRYFGPIDLSDVIYHAKPFFTF